MMIVIIATRAGHSLSWRREQRKTDMHVDSGVEGVLDVRTTKHANT